MAKSAGCLKPPVMINVVPAALLRSRWRRALASAGIVGDRDIVAKDQRCRTGTATSPIENDVVDAHLERSIDVLLDVLGRQLKAHRDPTGLLTHLVGEITELPQARPLRKAGR